MLMILWYHDQLGFYILGDWSSLDKSRRYGKDGMLKYLCMHMLAVVSSGSSVRIFIILGNLLIPRQIPKFR